MCYRERMQKSTSRPCRHSNQASESHPQKRPRHMTEEEYKEHRCHIKAKSRANMHANKKRRTREKDKVYRRMKRTTEKHAKFGSATPTQHPVVISAEATSCCNTPLDGPPNPVSTAEDQKVLKKWHYNCVSGVRKSLVKNSKTPLQFARMLKNICVNTQSPRKKQALRDVGLSFNSTSSLPKHSRRNLLQMKFCAARKKLLERKKRTDSLPTEDKRKIQCYFLREDVSRVLPNKRYARKEGAGYVMQQTLRGAYSMFKAEHPEIKVSYSLFTQLRPKNVRKISSTFSESCLCVYCLNVQLKLHALNRAVTVSGLGVEMKIPNERALFNILLCPKGDSPFPSSDCIYGQCQQCCDVSGTLRTHFQSLLDLRPTVTWNRWAHTASNGKTTREPETMQGSIEDLMQQLIDNDLKRPALNTTFITHFFTADWQYYQYRLLKQNLVKSCLSWILLKTAILNTKMKSSLPTSTSSKSHSIL